MSLLKRKTTSLKPSRKYLWILGILLLVGAILLINQQHSWWPFLKSASQIQQEQQTEYNNQKKDDTLSKNGKAGSGSSVPGQGTYTPPSSSDNITLAPTQSGDQVTLRTKLSGYSDGTCILTVKDGAKSFSQTASVIYQSEFSTCAGFTIPVSSLGTGSWNFNLDVVSGGITTTKTTTLEVK